MEHIGNIPKKKEISTAFSTPESPLCPLICREIANFNDIASFQLLEIPLNPYP